MLQNEDLDHKGHLASPVVQGKEEREDGRDEGRKEGRDRRENEENE